MTGRSSAAERRALEEALWERDRLREALAASAQDAVWAAGILRATSEFGDAGSASHRAWTYLARIIERASPDGRATTEEGEPT
jgi:hypothetical protein